MLLLFGLDDWFASSFFDGDSIHFPLGDRLMQEGDLTLFGVGLDFVGVIAQD